MSVQGSKKVRAALASHRKSMKRGLKTGLLRAGLFLQRESQKVVPIQYGVLKASANTRLEGTGFGITAVVSYGTDYAIYVHENLEARHKPGKIAKYLEEPLRQNQERIAEIIKDSLEEDS